MNIQVTKENDVVTLYVEGRVDTTTAPELEEVVNNQKDANALVMNFENLEYISSAGLRVLLSTHKIFIKKGGFTLTNISNEIREVLEITGFTDFLNIQ